MRLRLFFLSVLLSVTCLFGFTKPPELTPQITKKKALEILKSHIRYKQFDTEIAQRTLLLFVEELDPSKTYFLDLEIDKYTSPSEELLSRILADFRKGNFSCFEEVFQQMKPAVERRRQIETDFEGQFAPAEVNSQEFKDLKWAISPKELKERLIGLRSLQIQVAEKIDQNATKRFLDRLKKRRLKAESIFYADEESQKKHVLSFFLKAISTALDTHTNYFTPIEANQMMMQVQQKLVGIGAELRDDLNGFTLTRLLEGGPAMIGKVLKVGDRIIGVDHEPVIGMDIIEAVELIRGKKGTPVILTIMRETSEHEEKQKTFDITVIRDEIILQDSRYDAELIHLNEGDIAHLKLYNFYQDQESSSAQDLEKALRKMMSQNHIRGVILDLRNNVGGLLNQAVAVTSLFIDKGIVVSVKDNKGDIQHLRNLNDQPLWKGPLIVLTNVVSASASEIVAQTLQDYGRAFIVGDERTYGKGSYQILSFNSMHQANQTGEFKVTLGLYYTVSGKSPQLLGAQADISVPGEYSFFDIGECFAKFPLPNDSITANFQDSLSDIHPFYRSSLLKMYRNGKQEKSLELLAYLDTLREQSKIRIEQNKEYQAFLREVKKEERDVEKIEELTKKDFQLDEASNVMRDLWELKSQAQ